MSRSHDALALALAAGGLLWVGSGVAPDASRAQSTVAQQAHGGKRLGIGRAATAEEIAGWDIDIRHDGHGLPPGRGTVRQGEALYLTRCAACHGEFGEGAGRWPLLSGGASTLASHDPVKSVGSYWPYAATLMDYIRRTMPYGDAQSLSKDELYAVTAYVLYLNDVVADQDFELSQNTFGAIKLGNEANFYDDDRETTEQAFWKKDPCMSNCTSDVPKIIGRARALDVTPEARSGPKVE
jgi:S-disulfanyl-L-cysteine oxidoreductase SoxD